MSSATKHDVFISYAHKDRAFADLIRGYLLGRDLTVWTDAEIPPGDDWSDAIINSLEASHAVVLLLSPAFLSSQWNLYEAGVALAKDRERNGTVIPILIEDVEPDAVPSQLRRVAVLDGRSKDQRSVLQEMEERLGVGVH